MVRRSYRPRKTAEAKAQSVKRKFWDYGSPVLARDSNGEVYEYLTVVVFTEDSDGTVESVGVIPCATTPGDQLRHIGCPVSGPCGAHLTRVVYRVG